MPVLLEDYQTIKDLNRLPLEVIIRGLEAQLEVTPDDEYYRSYLVYAYYEAFKNYLKNKELEKAEEFLEKAGKILKDHRYHFYKALLFKEKGDLANSEIELKSSIRLKEDFYLSYYELGNVLKAKAEYEEALKAFSNAIKYMPDFVLPYLKIADIYMEKGILSSAKVFLEKILEIDPNFSEALLRLGVLYNIEQKYQKAIDYFRKALEISTDSWEIRYNLSYSLSRIGRHFEAIEELKKVLKSGIDEPFIYNELALLYKNMGFYEEAFENIRTTIEKSENWEYLFNGSKIAILLGNYQDSLDWIKRSIEVAENQNQEFLSKYWLSRIYMEFDDFENALNVIKSLKVTSFKLQLMETFLEKAKVDYPDTSTLLENFYDILEIFTENNDVDLLTFSEFVKERFSLDKKTLENIEYLLENQSVKLSSDSKGSYDILSPLLDLMFFLGHRFAAIERNLTKIVVAFHNSSESLAAVRLLVRIYEYLFLGGQIQIVELLDETVPELQDLDWNFALKLSTLSKLEEREEMQLFYELLEKDIVGRDLFQFMKYLVVILALDPELENIELIKNNEIKVILQKMKKLNNWAKNFLLQ
ncbi:MAG: hypothetical protein PWQ20_1158 [Thermotogaceae bacterium]|jgi:tetratricopeptide (TPR) repeat protein|nr:hypothetical protein [Thermotogaceae bacterium]MDN5338088.1 hypothetical protein [Thermotogaceae bacterium]